MLVIEYSLQGSEDNTFPSHEKQDSPQFTALVGVAPSLELQGAAFSAYAQFVNASKGEPWVTLVEAADKEVGRLVNGVEEHHE